MSENVNGEDLFGSGGHTWQWSDRPRTEQVLGTAGTSGVYSFPLHVSGRPVRIVSPSGGPAALRARAATRAAADAALDALEAAIEALADAGEEYAWEDDAGRTGDYLVVLGYRRLGPRRYGRSGTDWVAMQLYQCAMRENVGEVYA